MATPGVPGTTVHHSGRQNAAVRHVLRTYRQYRTQGRCMATRALRRLSSYANLREEPYTASLETKTYHSGIASVAVFKIQEEETEDRSPQ